MNIIVEKIKNLFRDGKGKLESEILQKSQSKNKPPVMVADDISRSTRESERLETRKKLWRNILY